MLHQQFNSVQPQSGPDSVAATPPTETALDSLAEDNHSSQYCNSSIMLRSKYPTMTRLHLVHFTTSSNS
ncbi:hypothetical protein FRX31_016089 [Thalictrum thalictroides]|uniref:Uncharacterized protein n=1 Tax=Thalictrum thalictroides TaxID=46969 RepID=A0A7J6WD71_THATH|nr:hypothetical protein FRX31_016089 [Thalictrum thalictroides]